MSCRPILKIVAPICLLVQLARAGLGADFRVETEIVDRSGEEVASRNLTIFHADKVYDFLDGTPAEVTVFESGTGDIILIERQRRLQTKLSHQKVHSMCQRMSELVRTAPVHFREMAFPDFRIKHVSKNERLILTLTGETLRYEITGSRNENRGVLSQYRSFADAFARLNGILYARPPQARIRVNASMVDRRILPETVELTYMDGSGFKATSHHAFQFTLNAEDLRRVRRVEANLRGFQVVDWENYRFSAGKTSSYFRHSQHSFAEGTTDHGLRIIVRSARNRS